MVPESTPGCENVPSPSLTEMATPASSRFHSASAPRMPVVTLPSMLTFPSSARSSPSKPPSVTRPQAARPGPVPSPSLARWNALPSSSSRPDRSRVVVPSRAWEPRTPIAVPGQPPAPDPGPAPASPPGPEADRGGPEPKPSSGAGPSEAPNARASAVSACVSTAPSSVCARSTRWPATVTCAPVSGLASRSETAPVTWSATVRPKRDSHIFCSGSSFVIVPVASPSAMRTPVAFESRSTNVSSPSSTASSTVA